jgi:general stress protein CsbA
VIVFAVITDRWYVAFAKGQVLSRKSCEEEYAVRERGTR